MRVLGIEVGEDLLNSWRRWLMPELQPFVVPEDLAIEAGWGDERARLSAEMRDSFAIYGLSATQWIIWLSRTQTRLLPRSVREAQPEAHRWPSRSVARDLERVVRYVERGRRPSRHEEVSDAHWARIRFQLPGAQKLAGSFARGSGPNCFGTVMGVAGTGAAAEEWVQLATFEHWLSASARPGGDDEAAGTLLVWRDSSERPVHAAITIGDGWLIHKPSQGWMSPVKVLSVQDGKYSARTSGWYLSRYRLL